MDARDYRKHAQAHTVKAAALLRGVPGLTEPEKLARLEQAVNHLASAMSCAAAARALAGLPVVPVTPPVDVELATMDLIDGLENLLGENVLTTDDKEES